MRIYGKTAAAVAALSLATAPALAAGSDASALSLRASTSPEKSEDLAGASIIGLIGVAAIIAGGVVIATDDDEPDSN